MSFQAYDKDDARLIVLDIFEHLKTLAPSSSTAATSPPPRPSSSLVLELGLILWSLLGWRFTLAQFAGGFVMIALLAVIFRLFLRPTLVKAPVSQARSDVQGKLQGHAEMDMSVADDRSRTKHLFSVDAFTAINHFFVSDPVDALRATSAAASRSRARSRLGSGRRLVGGVRHP